MPAPSVDWDADLDIQSETGPMLSLSDVSACPGKRPSSRPFGFLIKRGAERLS